MLGVSDLSVLIAPAAVSRPNAVSEVADGVVILGELTSESAAHLVDDIRN